MDFGERFFGSRQETLMLDDDKTRASRDSGVFRPVEKVGQFSLKVHGCELPIYKFAKGW